MKTQQYSYIVQALEILVMGLKRSKFNFHLKVTAMRLYCLVGAIEPCYELYVSLECKHIQMDTFSHMLFHDSLAHHIPDCSEPLLFSIERFYGDSLREVCIKMKYM